MKKLVLGAVVALGMASSVNAAITDQAVIWKDMCSKCHGANAEGNAEKHGSALNNVTASELEVDIWNLRNEGYQSSGYASETMTHNMRTIEEKKNMIVNSRKMAEYIFKNFSK